MGNVAGVVYVVAKLVSFILFLPRRAFRPTTISMKYTFTVCVFVFASVISAHGQRTWGIRLYQNTDFFKVEQVNGNWTEKKNHSNFDRFSLAITVTGKKNLLHEFELFIPEFNKSVDDVRFPYPYSFDTEYTKDHKIDTYSMRYAITKMFGPSLGKLRAGVGAGLNPYVTKTDFTNAFNETYQFPCFTQVLGISVNIVPVLAV